MNDYIPAIETSQQKKAREKIAKTEIQKFGMASLQYRFSEKEIFDAMENSRGLVAAACQTLGCHYAEFYRYLSKNKNANDYWNLIRKELIDKAENSLIQALDSDNEITRLSAAKFVLERLGNYKQNAQQIDIQHGNANISIKQIFGIGE